MKLFRIKERESGKMIKFNSVKEIDKLTNPSFSTQELRAFYNNDDPYFEVSTYAPYTMKQVCTLTRDEVISLLKRYEASQHEILAEYGTQYDTYSITNHRKHFEHNNQKYTYLFILPDYNENTYAMFLSNDVDHYTTLREEMNDNKPKGARRYEVS